MAMRKTRMQAHLVFGNPSLEAIFFLFKGEEVRIPLDLHPARQNRFAGVGPGPHKRGISGAPAWLGEIHLASPDGDLRAHLSGGDDWNPRPDGAGKPGIRVLQTLARRKKTLGRFLGFSAKVLY